MRSGYNISFEEKARPVSWYIPLMLVCLCLFLTGSSREQPSALNGEMLPPLEEVMDASERIWSYTDDPARLAQIRDEGWMSADHDDSGWLRAAGSFGAYEGRLKEIEDGICPDVCLRHYLSDGDTVPTYYFRLSFSADLSTLTETLCTDIVYDDAVIIYLNGTEIFSGNVPGEGYPYPNAYGCDRFYDEMPRETVTLERSLFRDGENILCVELHQANESSSDIYFSMGDWSIGPPREAKLRNESLCLCVGADETQALITWRGPIQEEAYVQIMPKNNSGGDFSDAARYPAERVYEEDEICSYRVQIDGLKPGEYIYRAVDRYPTNVYDFVVGSPDNGFSFLCHGDAQIVDEDDEDAMEEYLILAEYAMGEDVPQLILSLGDQVDEAGNEKQYRQFTDGSLLKEIPLAAVVGNHERNSEMFSRAFCLPNMDRATEDSSGDMSGDYWFFRGNTLFLCLNSNNRDTNAHREFLLRAKEACAERYGDPVWTVAAFHHSLFSAGEHRKDEAIIDMRAPYAAMLEEAGVDVVFSGHDHTYTRTWPMKGQSPLQGEGSDGIVYFTLGSSTGSKYYSIIDDGPEYAAFSNGEHDPAITRVDVTDDRFTVTTYQMRKEGIVMLDTFHKSRSQSRGCTEF